MMSKEKCEVCGKDKLHTCIKCKRSVCSVHGIYYVSRDLRIWEMCVDCGRKAEQYEKRKYSRKE